MSEYTPITGELRGAMHQWGWVESDGSITFVSSPMPPSIDAEKSLAIIGSVFDRCCDAIDAIHAQLEREYDELRMKYVNMNRHAQHVERENESLKAELDRVLGEQENLDGWVELPKDADGVLVELQLVTPAQAIAATVGSGTCEADETETIKCWVKCKDEPSTEHMELIHVMECSECGHTYEHVNGDYEFCPRCGRKRVDE